MTDVDVSDGLGVGTRRRRSAVERRRVVEETLEAGASVARVALKYGVNANQVFQWSRLYRDGKVGASSGQAMQLLPVSLTEDQEPPGPGQVEDAVAPQTVQAGAIHIELPGEIRISLEGNVDPAVVRVVLKSLRS